MAAALSLEHKLLFPTQKVSGGCWGLGDGNGRRRVAVPAQVPPNYPQNPVGASETLLPHKVGQVPSHPMSRTRTPAPCCPTSVGAEPPSLAVPTQRGPGSRAHCGSRCFSLLLPGYFYPWQRAGDGRLCWSRSHRRVWGEGFGLCWKPGTARGLVPCCGAPRGVPVPWGWGHRCHPAGFAP